MAKDIYLYNENGLSVLLEAVDELEVDTPTPGSHAFFTEGVIEAKSVTLDLGSGNQTITAPAGKLWRQVTILKPATLISGNIKNNIEIAGVIGDYAGVIPSGNVDIVDLSSTDVSGKATAQVSAAERVKLISGNIKSGVTILGVAGSYSGIDTSDADAVAGDLLDGKTAYVNGEKIAGTIPVDNNLGIWVTKNGTFETGGKYFRSDTSVMVPQPDHTIVEGDRLSKLYFNQNFPFAAVIAKLKKELSGELLLVIPLLACGDPETDANWLTVTLAFDFVHDAASVYTTISQNGVAATFYQYDGLNGGWSAFVLDLTHYNLPAVSATADIWYNLCANLCGKSAAAYGDYIPKPTQTLTITQNGTYDITGYASVVVNVSGEQCENVTVDGDTLVFHGDTAVDGDTLILAADAHVDGDMLIIDGGQDAEVQDDVLVIDAELRDGALEINGHLSDDGKILILD